MDPGGGQPSDTRRRPPGPGPAPCCRAGRRAHREVRTKGDGAPRADRLREAEEKSNKRNNVPSDAEGSAHRGRASPSVQCLVPLPPDRSRRGPPGIFRTFRARSRLTPAAGAARRANESRGWLRRVKRKRKAAKENTSPLTSERSFPSPLGSDTLPTACGSGVPFSPVYPASLLLPSQTCSARSPPEKGLFLHRTHGVLR